MYVYIVFLYIRVIFRIDGFWLLRFILIRGVVRLGLDLLFYRNWNNKYCKYLIWFCFCFCYLVMVNLYKEDREF